MEAMEKEVKSMKSVVALLISAEFRGAKKGEGRRSDFWRIKGESSKTLI